LPCKPIEEVNRYGDGLLTSQEPAFAAATVEFVGEVPPQVTADDELRCRVVDFGEFVR
jgi:hypothetical protein